MVNWGTLAEDDGPALRRELALRILLQNLLLILSLVLFSAFAMLMLMLPATAWPAAAAAAHGVASFGAVLQWCHHGIRTRQIKQYLLASETGQDGGWERWLPANRPRTLLGSRWMISTKGVFLGLQLALTGLAWRIQPEPDLPFVSITAGLLVASAGFLLTNPKE